MGSLRPAPRPAGSVVVFDPYREHYMLTSSNRMNMGAFNHMHLHLFFADYVSQDCAR